MQSALENFGQTIVKEEWSFLESSLSSSTQVERFQDFCSNLVENYFPQKTTLVSAYDQPFFNDRLRLLRRQRQREYRKNGNSDKYKSIKKAFDESFLAEAHKYKDKIIADVVEGKRGSAYKALKRLSTGNPVDDSSFEIPSHIESNLSAEQSAEIFADYFSAISQEFEPIDQSKFTPDLKEKLANSNEKIPILEEHYVYKKIVHAKKPNSSVPGDLPKKIVTSFAVELAKPASIIYNSISTTAEYPRPWVVEYQTPIPKVNPPTCEDELRNISGTPFLSKVYESCLSDWLMPLVMPFLDPSNCGGLKGVSISHYLIRLLHFIHSSVDRSTPTAVVLALVDLSKAFNRVDHCLVIQDLHDMKVPAWLLKILISYLTERTMVIKFRGATSTVRSLPGSSPQGVFLGCFFFLIKFNGAFLRPDIPRPFPKPVPLIDSKSSSCTVKYIDDASQARAINLRKALIQIDTSDRPRPLEFHEHTGYILDAQLNQLQQDLDDLKAFTDKNLMVINEKKTQILCFNFRTSLQFPPIFTVGESAPLDIVKEAKLLGIIISDDLKWSSHVEYMCKKASKKIWLIRRMKNLKLSSDILLDFYLKEVRSILEFGAVVWCSGLTGQLTDKIERIQKICVSIILCDADKEIPYTIGCTLLGIEPLTYRRTDLCTRFVQKAARNPKHSDLFAPNTNTVNTRQEKLPYREHTGRNSTGRFHNSPLCYLTRLLNDNPGKDCTQK